MYIVSCSTDRRINVWDRRMNKILSRFQSHTGAVNDVVFYPDGQYLASCSDDRTIRVWDCFYGSELLCLSGHQGPVSKNLTQKEEKLKFYFLRLLDFLGVKILDI